MRAPTADGTGRDLLSDGAGSSAGPAAGPRPVVEAAVSGVAPDDASEGNKLNLTINNFSPSEVAAVAELRIDACSTSACRGGGDDLASTPTPAAAAPASFASLAHGGVLETLAP